MLWKLGIFFIAIGLAKLIYYCAMKVRDKYQEKAGIISKSYKLKRTLVEEFAGACDKAGVSQAAQLSKMMEEFIASIIV